MAPPPDAAPPSSVDSPAEHFSPLSATFLNSNSNDPTFEHPLRVQGHETAADRRRLARLCQVRRLAGLVSVLALVILATPSLRGSVELTPSVVLPALAAMVAWVMAVGYTFRTHSARMDSLIAVTRLASVQAEIEHITAAQGALAQVASGAVSAEPEGAAVQCALISLHSLVIDLKRRLVVIGERIERALLAGTIAAATGAMSLATTVVSSLGLTSGV